MDDIFSNFYAIRLKFFVLIGDTLAKESISSEYEYHEQGHDA